MTGSTPRRRSRKQVAPVIDLNQMLAAAEASITPDGWAASRKTLGEAFGLFKQGSGEEGERVCAYTQGTHWAMLDMFTIMQDQIEARDYVLRALLERLGRLEAQIGQQRSVIYRGVFDGSEKYEPGNMVTHAGSCWHANEATSEAPGSSTAWTLAVKRGRDGKDAR